MLVYIHYHTIKDLPGFVASWLICCYI